MYIQTIPYTHIKAKYIKLSKVKNSIRIETIAAINIRMILCLDTEYFLNLRTQKIIQAIKIANPNSKQIIIIGVFEPLPCGQGCVAIASGLSTKSTDTNRALINIFKIKLFFTSHLLYRINL